MTAPSKETVFRIATISLALVISVLVSEVALRTFVPIRPKYITIGEDAIYPSEGLANPIHYTFDSISGYSLIPNINDIARQITTDQYGFRVTGRTYDESKSSIIFVGDSTVFGWAVKDTATFAYLLADRFAHHDLNFINMGVPSYSLGHIGQVLKYKVPEYDPTLVFVSILWPWLPFNSYSNTEAWKTVDFDFYRQTIPARTEFVGDSEPDHTGGLYTLHGRWHDRVRVSEKPAPVRSQSGASGTRRGKDPV